MCIEARGRIGSRPALYFPGRSSLAYHPIDCRFGSYRTASRVGQRATPPLWQPRFRRAPLSPFSLRCVVTSVEARSRGIPASVVVGRTSRTALVSSADSSRPWTAGEIERGGIPGTGLCDEPQHSIRDTVLGLAREALTFDGGVSSERHRAGNDEFHPSRSERPVYRNYVGQPTHLLTRSDARPARRTPRVRSQHRCRQGPRCHRR